MKAMRFELIYILASLIGCSGPSKSSTDEPFCSLQTDDSTTSDARQLWSHEVAPGPIRWMVKLGFEERFIFSGTPSGGAAMFEVAGNGAPLWELPFDGEFLVAAARTRDIFYGVSVSPFGEQANVYRFQSSSPDPIWTYDVTAAGFSMNERRGLPNRSPVATTPDGGLLALPAVSDDQVVILVFSPDGPEPIQVLPTNRPASELNIISIVLTADGDKLFYFYEAADGRVLHRVDRASEELEFTLSLTPGAALAISPDGSVVILGGFGFVSVFRWSGDAYDELWRFRPGDHGIAGVSYPGAAAIAANREVFAVAWMHEPLTKITTAAFSVDCHGAALWLHTTPESNGDFQDVPSALTISADGSWIALGTWGTQDNVHPEVLLFHQSRPGEVMFGLDTPGSALALDMAQGGDVLALGTKAVHQNVRGNGGGVFAVELLEDLQ